MIFHCEYRCRKVNNLKLFRNDLFDGYLVKSFCVGILRRIAVIHSVDRLGKKYRLGLNLDGTQNDSREMLELLRRIADSSDRTSRKDNTPVYS